MEDSVLMGLKILHEVYIYFPGNKSQMSAESLCVHCGKEPQQFQLSELDAQGSDFPRSLESRSERAEGDL